MQKKFPPHKKSDRVKMHLGACALAAGAFLAAKVSAEEQEAHAGKLKNWEMYGSVRLEGAYWKHYKWYEYAQAPDADGDAVRDSIFHLDSLPSTQLRMGLQNNSYFGVRGKGEKFGFGFEMGLSAFVQSVGLSGQQTGTVDELSLSQSRRQSTMLRKIYGDWYVNDMTTVRIGQDWNIANFFLSNQVYNSDAGLGYSGILYTGRRPLVKVTVGSDKKALVWKAEAAAIKQHADPLPGETFGPPGGAGYLQKTEEKLPKFEFGGEIGYKSGLFSGKTKVVGGFTQYDAVIYQEDALSSQVGDLRAAVKSNILGGYADVKVWKIGLALTYTQGKNPASYGVWTGNPDASLSDASMRMFFPTYTADTAGVPKMANASIKQSGGIVSFQVLPWLTWEAGGGMVDAEHDDPSIKNIRTLNAFKRRAYYSNLQFTAADGHFLIVPEFSLSDFGGFKKSRTEEPGGLLYSYGLKLELDI